MKLKEIDLELNRAKLEYKNLGQEMLPSIIKRDYSEGNAMLAANWVINSSNLSSYIKELESKKEKILKRNLRIKKFVAFFNFW